MQRLRLRGLGWLAIAAAVALASPAWSRPLTRPARTLHGVNTSTHHTSAAKSWVSSTFDDDDSAPLEWVARTSTRTTREWTDTQSRVVSAEPARMNSKGPGAVTFGRRKVPAHADDSSDPDCPVSLH